MDEPRQNGRPSVFQAVCENIPNQMRTRGYDGFHVQTGKLNDFEQLPVAVRTREYERVGGVQHLLFVTADEEKILVRIADYLPIWREKLPTIHVECRGEVWVTGKVRSAFLLALVECVQATVTAALASRLPCDG